MKKLKKEQKKRTLPLAMETVRLMKVAGGEPTIIVGSDTCSCGWG